VPDIPSAAEIAPYLERIDGAKWYTNFGPLNAELEARLAARFTARPSGDPVVRTVANATLGIELALAALRLPSGSPILVPALTFTATAAAIVRSGHVPVFSDIDPASWLLTPAIAREVARDVHIAAALPVCAYGCPQDVAEWDRFAAETGAKALIDAAGAFGNQCDAGRACTVFSLHATKSLGAGEGGFVVSCDADLVAQVKRLSNFGIDVSTGYVTSPGTNAKLSEFHAAVALAALDGWEQRAARRHLLHRRYLDALIQYCPNLTAQHRPAQGAYTIMPVLLPKGSQAIGVARQLSSKGIETRRWYCPTLERHPAYSGYSAAGALAVTAEMNERLLGLPFHPGMSEEAIHFVCRALADALAAGGRQR